MRWIIRIIRVSILACLSALVFIFLAEAQTKSTKGSQGPVEKVKNPPAAAPLQTGVKKEVIIKCPLTHVRTEITTPLPMGWWQTPQEGNLIRTKIQKIGGQSTLCCGYWGYDTVVWIMHKWPDGLSDCKTLSDGFMCYAVISK